MASLVPYAAGEGPELLSTMLPMVYKDTKWAARKIGRGLKRAYKRRRKARYNKRARTDIGEPVKHIHVKRDDTFVEENQDLATRTLDINELTAIDGGTGEATRSRQLINCKGIQLTMHLHNKTTQVLYFNWAVIAPKHTQSGVSTIDFFRSQDGGRGTNFSTALTPLELHYNPINTDRYTVLRHKRLELDPLSDTIFYNSDTGRGNHKTTKIWIPINRQLRYDSQVSTTCNTPIYFVYWCDLSRAASSTTSTANAATLSYMHTMFFTDVL